MSASHCSTCGRPIADGMQGLCASCMMQWVVEEAVDPQPLVTPKSDEGGSALNYQPVLLNLPGYEVYEEIARGGMGIVYRARQLEPQRPVALKMLLPHQVASPGMLERFRLEARAIAALEHPAILPVHEVGEHNGLPFFTMKLATGGTLARRKDAIASDWRAIAELVVTLADAVQFAHERGVLHRDLKPGNVLFDEAGRPYVSDFGLAKLVGADSDLTRSVELLGTPHYVAPEVAARSAKDATTASDVYSLGAILYELLAGRPPFQAEGVPALLKKIVEDDVPLEPLKRLGAKGVSSTPQRFSASTPRDLQVICLKSLAKAPARRYASARELAEDLRRWLAGRTILARPATRLERVRAWVRRNPALATMSGLLALVLVTAVIRQAWSNRQLQHALAESLLREARLKRASGQMGQRLDTLSLISAAVDQLRKSWTGISRSNLFALRTEAAAALALPDARPRARWPVDITHFENELHFTANLDRYITPARSGGFTVFSTTDQRPLRHFVHATNDPVVRLRLSPDGHWAAARFQDGHVELHSLLDRQPPRLWPGERNYGAIFAFAPSGGRFGAVPLTPDKPRLAEVIDLESGDTLAQLPASSAGQMAFNQDGTLLALAGTELVVWRLSDTNQLWATPLDHGASTLEWSPDQRHLALSLDRAGEASESKRETNPLLLFDAGTGRQESILAEFGSTAGRLAFAPDSQSLVAATWADHVLWASLRPIQFRMTVPGAHRALQFAPDGRTLGYAPSRDELGLVELVTPAVWREWRMDSPSARTSFSIDISADGRWVATGAEDGVHLWDAEQRVERAICPTPARAWWMPVLFGPGDRFLYYSAANFGVRRVELLRTRTPEGDVRIQFGSYQQLGPPQDNMAIGLATDGRSLIVGENRRQTRNERFPPTMWLWPDGNPAGARKLAEGFPMVGYRQIPGSPWATTTDLISPDVWIWNIETGARVRSLGIPIQANSEPVQNGRWVVTRTRQEFAVWETGTWRAIARWPARADEQDSGQVIASKDSRLLVSDTAGGGLVLRKLPGGTELVKLIPPRNLALRQWTFSPDGRRLIILTNSGRVVEWDLAELRRELATASLDWE